MIGRFSRFSLLVTSACNLKCTFCDLWQEGQSSEALRDLIASGDFFKKFPRKTWVDVIGGDPFMDESLSYVLAYLKSEGVKVRLWSHGIVSGDQLVGVSEFVDEFYLYLPNAVDEEYQLVSGWGTFEEFNHSVQLLIQESKKVVLHVPITEDNIGELPDAYEYAYDNDLDLVFHYPKVHNFDREQVDFIKRFYDVRRVYVYPVKAYSNYVCAALPGESFFHLGHWVKNVVFDFLARFR